MKLSIHWIVSSSSGFWNCPSWKCQASGFLFTPEKGSSLSFCAYFYLGLGAIGEHSGGGDHLLPQFFSCHLVADEVLCPLKIQISLLLTTNEHSSPGFPITLNYIEITGGIFGNILLLSIYLNEEVETVTFFILSDLSPLPEWVTSKERKALMSTTVHSFSPNLPGQALESQVWKWTIHT